MTADPSFTVIVPTRNRPRQLAECLDALAQLDFDDFEVVVVDDGGADDLAPIVGGFAPRLAVRLVRTAHGGPGAARNAGGRHARGRNLAFTDDDCQPSSDWLSRLDVALGRAPKALVGGRTINRLVANPYSTTSQIVVDVAYAYHNAGPDGVRFLASNNMALPADRFAEIGGFDARFVEAAEDRDLCDRWRARGLPLRYVESALVHHAHHLSLGSFWRQHVRYGRGARRFHRARAARGTGSFRSELRFHARLLRLLPGPLSELPPSRRVSVGGLLALWQIANVVGFALGAKTPSPDLRAGASAGTTGRARS